MLGEEKQICNNYGGETPLKATTWNTQKEKYLGEITCEDERWMELVQNCVK